MSNESKQAAIEERILVCTPRSADLDEAISTLQRNGFRAEACAGYSKFCEEIAQGAGAGVVSEEAWEGGKPVLPLARFLAEQPAWSDFPLIVVTDGRENPQALDSAARGGNLLFVERPIREEALVNAVRVALRARRRQYEARVEIEALRRSEEKFRLMVESAVEYAIFSMDCAGLITSWNTGAERLLGYSEDEVIGRPLEIIFTPEDRANRLPERVIREARASSQAIDERWHVRKDGGRFWASGQVMPMLDEDGKTRGYVKVLRDYTGRKRAETWLRALNETLEKRVEERTAEAEHRAAQLQLLAAEITQAEERERRRLAELLHDHLQQLLVAAKMQVGMLSQRKLIEQPFVDGLDRVEGLLERSIEASRSLTVELSPPILYDAGLGPALQWLARRMQEDHGLEVSAEAAEKVGPDSENVRVFLFQAVRELLLNIVKHAGVKKAKVEVRRIKGEVEVAVFDAGIGFDIDSSHSRQEKRGGFGLFSISERVGLLGGSVSIETAPGKGTSVRVRVPRSEPSRAIAGAGLAEDFEAAVKEREGRARPEIAGEAGRIRILLADDHKILREGLAGLLRDQADFDIVSEASDGQMAVEMARETQPDVIVMDVSMPRLNGVEATRKIVEEMPRVKVIGLSMHAQEDMADAMRGAGAIGYVTKGAPSEILTAAIREAALAE